MEPLARQVLIGQDTKSPLVDGAGVVGLGNDKHLGRKVVESATQSISSITRRMDTITKVGLLKPLIEANQDILRLDVAVHDHLAM